MIRENSIENQSKWMQVMSIFLMVLKKEYSTLDLLVNLFRSPSFFVYYFLKFSHCLGCKSIFPLYQMNA